MIGRLTILSLFVPIFTGDASFARDETQKAVLITGASTGIGHNMAETQATKGYY